MTNTYEISDEMFEKSVRKFIEPPKEPKERRGYERLTYFTFDQYEGFNRIEDPGEWSDYPEKEEELKKLGPPPMPKFNQQNRGHKITNIEDILYEPGRLTRAEKIMIFIRGAPGSGKTFLANLIIRKEEELGNTRCRFITPNRYYPKAFDRNKVEHYSHNLYSETRDVILEGFYSFVVVEIEGGDINIYNRLVDLAVKEGGFDHYAIDILQEFEVCLKYCKHGRAYNDVEKICKEIIDHVVPYYNKIINPVELVEPGWTARQPIPEPKRWSPPPRRRIFSKGRYYDDDDDDDACFSCHG